MQHLLCASATPRFIIMPSQRKRIGFLPSEEVHKIIDKLCRDNEISQSKVTGLLVEEALRSRGVLSDSFPKKIANKSNFTNSSFKQESLSRNNKSSNNSDMFTLDKKVFSDDIKMMHEFIEFKYFKKVMKRNNNIIE